VKTFSPNLLISLFSASCLVSCASRDDEAALIASDIEEVNGALTMDDEDPAFAEAAVYEALEAEDPEAAATDPMEADPEVSDMVAAPDVVAYAVTVAWGQFPFNPDAELVRDWSGAFAVNRGAILVRSVLRFEDATDRLLPREDRRIVAFASKTLPHHDGMRLLVLDPDPTNAEPLVLGYQGLDGTTARIALADLAMEGVQIEVDDAGNRIVAVASRRGLDVCNHGFLQGQWRTVEEGRGRLRGRVVDADGVLLGHVRGVFGVRESGEQVFFGKYIDLDGAFRGIFAGGYRDGHFMGRWLSRTGEHGRLGGEYREASPDRPAGRFLGRWQQTSCDI
jgi:hypothetical protein